MAPVLIDLIGIGISGQPSAEILLFKPLQAGDAFGDHFLMEGIQVVHREAQVAEARWNGIGGNSRRIAGNVGKVQGQRASRRLELGPLGRLESDRQAENIAVEGDGSGHVADEDDGVAEFGHW